MFQAKKSAAPLNYIQIKGTALYKASTVDAPVLIGELLDAPYGKKLRVNIRLPASFDIITGKTPVNPLKIIVAV